MLDLSAIAIGWVGVAAPIWPKTGYFRAKCMSIFGRKFLNSDQPSPNESVPVQ